MFFLWRSIKNSVDTCKLGGNLHLLRRSIYRSGSSIPIAISLLDVVKMDVSLMEMSSHNNNKHTKIMHLSCIRASDLAPESQIGALNGGYRF